MKRILCIATLLFCMSFAGSVMSQIEMTTEAPQKDEVKTFTFAGVNYQGDFGFVFGTGQTFGRVTILPYARFSLDSTLTDEIRFKKTFGTETIIWLYRQPTFQLGLVATLFTLDWLENQEQPIGTFVSQSAGPSLHWVFTDGLALNVTAKIKAQLFATQTSYEDRWAIYVILVTDKLTFLKLF